jgi:hypothetical protein
LSTDKVSVELKHAKEALQLTREELDTVKGDLQVAQIDLLTANMVLNTMLTEVIPQIIELVISEEPTEENPEEIPEE